jgi:hypothetical protein
LEKLGYQMATSFFRTREIEAQQGHSYAAPLRRVLFSRFDILMDNFA